MSFALAQAFMESIEANTHVFVIRIWREEVEGEERMGWRGHVTHALTGTRSHVRGVADIAAFIAPYLEPDEPAPPPAPDA